MTNKNINFENVPDSVTKPIHYHKGGIDVIGFLQEHFPERKYTISEGFFIGNAIKYICRYKEKNGIEDLTKAADYVQRLMDLEKGSESDEKNS